MLKTLTCGINCSVRASKHLDIIRFIFQGRARGLRWGIANTAKRKTIRELNFSE